MKLFGFYVGQEVQHKHHGKGVIKGFDAARELIMCDFIGKPNWILTPDTITPAEAEVVSGPLIFDKPEQKSARHNEGKVQLREVDPDFILGIAEVLTKSRAKYDAFNWQKDTPFSVPYESLMRHLMAFQKGEEIDKESGCHHLLHVATNVMFLYYHRNNTKMDDRGFKKK